MDANGAQRGREPDSGKDIMTRAQQSTHYTPPHAVARVLKPTKLVLSRTTSIPTVMVDDNRLHLGITLKFGAKKLRESTA